MKHRNFYGIAILLLGLALYHIAALSRDTVRIEDSAVYVLLAEALASGRGYTNISYVGDPSNVQYPPFFPLILTPVVYFFGRNFLLMKVVVLLFAFASLLFTYLFIERRAGEKKALLITAVLGISPTFFVYSHEVMSEIAYLCFSLLTLHFLRRYNRERRWLTSSGASAVIFIILAYFTRSIGLSLLLAAPVSLLLLKPAGKLQYRLLAATVFAVFCALPILAWTVRSSTLAWSANPSLVREQLGSKPLYTDYFFAKNEFAADDGMVESVADLWPRIYHNSYAYIHGTAALLFPSIFPSAGNLMAASVALLVLFGFLSSLWQQRAEMEMYVGFYGLAILLYPTAAAPRYLLPLFPFLLLYFLNGVAAITYLWTKRLTGAVMASLAIALLGINIWAVAFSPSKMESELTDFQQVAAWIKDHTPPDTAIMSRKPNLFYLASDRKGIRFPFTTDGERILQELCATKVNHVVQDSFSPVTERYLAPVIRQNQEIFTEAYSRNKTRIFEVNRPHTCRRMSHIQQESPSARSLFALPLGTE